METKYYNELTEAEKNQFNDTIAYADENVLKFAESIDEKNTNIEIAFNDEGAMIDFRIFDPYSMFESTIYTYANGWSNWFFENVD